MTTRIAPKPAPIRPPKKEALAPKLGRALATAAGKLKKDELSTGLGRKLGQLGKKPPLGDLKRILQNQAAARNLKGSIQGVLKLVRFAGPLPKDQSPRMGPNGQMVAPNGDPLIRVKLSDGPVSGSSQYALVNPKTNEFYVQNNQGGFTHPTTYNGPLSLPPDARFVGDKFTPADLKNLETLANAPPRISLQNIKEALASGQLEFDQPAPKPGNVASEKVIMNAHPFTYYAVVLKDDPNHVVIKKVLTGGIIGPKPGDGSYSEPIAIS